MLNNVIRKAVSGILAAIMLTAGVYAAGIQPVSAAETADSEYNVQGYTPVEVQPRWSSLISVLHRIAESPSGYVNPSYTLLLEQGAANKVSIKTQLQQYNNGWSTIKTWSKDIAVPANAVVTYTEKFFVGKKNADYRFYYTIQTYKNNAPVDKVTGYSETLRI